MKSTDIAKATFSKARIGGYDMRDVDVFLEKVKSDYASYEEEISTLKMKLKVIVDEVLRLREAIAQHETLVIYSISEFSTQDILAAASAAVGETDTEEGRIRYVL